jgi:hypothetical protein
MHFFSTMTAHAPHVVLRCMSITLSPGSDIFIAHPASVTGCALIYRIRPLPEDMAIDKAFFNILRPAYMTASAAGMTGSAMPLTALFNVVPFRHI